MNNWMFCTGGDWSSTTLKNHGEDLGFAQLFFELHAGRFANGSRHRGGIQTGGEMTAIYRPQPDSNDGIGIFPGRLEMNFPGYTICIENYHPMFAFEHTRIWFNGMEMTHQIMDICVDICGADNRCKAYFTFCDHSQNPMGEPFACQPCTIDLFSFNNEYNRNKDMNFGYPQHFSSFRPWNWSGYNPSNFWANRWNQNEQGYYGQNWQNGYWQNNAPFYGWNGGSQNAGYYGNYGWMNNNWPNYSQNYGPAFGQNYAPAFWQNNAQWQGGYGQNGWQGYAPSYPWMNSWQNNWNGWQTPFAGWMDNASYGYNGYNGYRPGSFFPSYNGQGRWNAGQYGWQGYAPSYPWMSGWQNNWNGWQNYGAQAPYEFGSREFAGFNGGYAPQMPFPRREGSFTGSMNGFSAPQPENGQNANGFRPSFANGRR